jgi:hypothetical protein
MVPHALWYCTYVIRCLGTFMLRGMLIAVCNSTIVLDADLLLIKNSFSESSGNKFMRFYIRPVFTVP